MECKTLALTSSSYKNHFRVPDFLFFLLKVLRCAGQIFEKNFLNPIFQKGLLNPTRHLSRTLVTPQVYSPAYQELTAWEPCNSLDDSFSENNTKKITTKKSKPKKNFVYLFFIWLPN